MGYAIAEAARAVGWKVTLISGPVALARPEGIELISVVTGEEMLAAVRSQWGDNDVLIKTAAVCDMRPVNRADHKVKKNEMEWVVPFEPTTDILRVIAASNRDGQVVVGFAAQTQDIEAHARKKLVEKKLDYICANQVAGANSAFESDRNALRVIGRDGAQWCLGPAAKKEVATALIALLADDHRLACLPLRKRLPD